MKTILPSTSMLRAFDRSARTGSFTAAARELNLTQGAISRQVIALEKQLGVTLFERRHHEVVLTKAGCTYANDIRAALDLIVTASMRVRSNPQSGTLKLAILPTFGTRWLMPRLPGFLEAHPDITVHFVTKRSPFEFRTEDLHAAIHHGMPDWPDADHTYLMGEEVVPVCSPAFLAEFRPKRPAELEKKLLLHVSSRAAAWSDWFAAQETAMPDCAGMYFEEFAAAAQAAVAGMGAALLPRFLIQGELDQGQLVSLFDLPYESEQGYFLVTPNSRIDYAPVVAFKGWLLKTVKADSDSKHNC
jgi:LysR family transcriptional regulator, glycine cleavage system transcriptional activator